MIDPQVALERVRGDAVLLAEPPDELEPAEPGLGGELGQRDPLVPALAQMMPSPADRRVLGPVAAARRRSRPQVWTKGGDRSEHRLVDREIAGWLGGERGMGTLERAAQRAVAEHDPASGARAGAVALGPVVQQPRLDVQDLVGPPLRDRRHPGVDGLGLEHEQLALAGALMGGVELEPRRSALDDRHRPGRVRMGPIDVLDEPGVERLDAVYPLRAEIRGVLRRRPAKVRPPACSPSSSTRRCTTDHHCR